MTERTCVICGVSIEGYHPHAKVCSDQCRDDRISANREARRPLRQARQCVVCEGMVGENRAPNALTCSDNCYRQHKNRKRRAETAERHRLAPGRQCQGCGIDISGKHPTALFCTRECLLAHDRAAKLSVRAVRHCSQCNAVISEDRSPKALTCSRECGLAHNRQYSLKRYLSFSTEQRAYDQEMKRRRRERPDQREKHRERGRATWDQYRAALKLIREIETKGLEALL